MGVVDTAPSVPMVRNGVLDLTQLVGANLDTFIPVGDFLQPGDFIKPSWLGRKVDGAAQDYTVQVIYQPELVEPEGFPIRLNAEFVRSLDGGDVFYSFFRIRGETGEESRRVYFQVGVRREMATPLPAPSIRESHDLHLDPDSVGSTVTVVFSPYQAMAKGDRVELTWQGRRADGSAVTPYIRTVTVADAHLGQPLTWEVSQAQWITLGSGSIELSCKVTFAEGSTVSRTRTLSLSAPPAALLPPATIKDFSGTELDPSAWPEGIELQAELYPDAQVDDILLLYWTGPRAADSVILYTRLDASSLEKDFVAFHLPYQWLIANKDRRVEVHYQYARATASGSSQPLRLNIREPLTLAKPSVERAVSGSNGMAELRAQDAVAGAYVLLPAELDLGPDDEVAVIWAGHGETGYFQGSQSEPGAARFRVPPSAVPANMGLTFEVYYQVTQPGMAPVDSEKLDLRILPLPVLQLPLINCLEATTGTPPQLRVSPLPQVGARLRLDRWAFIAPGQLLYISATSGPHQETVRNWMPVTSEEASAGVDTYLRKAFLQSVGDRVRVTLHVAVKFDVSEEIEPTDFRTFEMEIIQ